MALFEYRRIKLQMAEGTQQKKKCKWTKYINDWDKAMDYSVPSGKAIYGIQSVHNNKKE